MKERIMNFKSVLMKMMRMKRSKVFYNSQKYLETPKIKKLGLNGESHLSFKTPDDWKDVQIHYILFYYYFYKRPYCI